ncbi:MtnX-like HAD-IB family phosphatase [Chloroflexota bacterium]
MQSEESEEKIKTLIQCDFDGTITEEDISFLILDAFTNGDWRRLFKEYKEDKITVGSFNKRAFRMVRQDENTLRQFVKEKSRIRDGFPELLNYCRQKGFRFVIVSNGLEFYIKAILESIGIDKLEVFAARAVFNRDGIEASYIGPDGIELQDDFKKAYIRNFLKKDYRIIYIGNGTSDIPSARLADHVFATDVMLANCRQANVKCTAFSSLRDIIMGLELLG